MTQALVEEPWQLAQRRQRTLYGDLGGNRMSPRVLSGS